MTQTFYLGANLACFLHVCKNGSFFSHVERNVVDVVQFRVAQN